jgi:PAS domain S-box-containing protein
MAPEPEQLGMIQRPDNDPAWRSVFETAHFGVALTDFDFCLITTNAAFKNLTGYAGEELKGLSLLDLCIEG